MKIPDSIRDAIPIFVRALSERLLGILMGRARDCAVAANGHVTVDIFLAALYRNFPDETASFFSDTEPLARMAEELCPRSSRSRAVVPLPSFGDPRPLMLVGMDDTLVFALWQGAKFSSAAGRGPADLADFIGALSLDDDTVARLHRERGLLLKGYLGLLR